MVGCPPPFRWQAERWRIDNKVIFREQRNVCAKRFISLYRGEIKGDE
jgi:hypothetical protein